MRGSMGLASGNHDERRSERDRPVAASQVRVRWPEDAPSLDQEAELIDRLFGVAIKDLFKDSL